MANRIEIAGSARRWTETCKDLDLIATTDDAASLVEALATHGLSAESRRGGDVAASVLTHAGLKVDLRIGTEETFGNLLQHFTGSAEHNVELRERALQRGYSVSEHGVAEVEGKKVHRFPEEAGVYELLGLPYIEPELREGRGEIEAGDTGELPDLVTVDDIRGDLHCHTTLSDGRNSLEEMAAEARRRGYAYLAITDHSASHGFGNHVTDKQLAKRIEEIRAWNESAPRGFRLLAGSEVNIGLDGSLDYPDELLAELDWVMGSVHTSFAISEQAMTERVIAAMENPMVDCIGHLTGRLLLRREPYAVDMVRIAEAAARTGTMMEINGNPNRRDLNEQQCEARRGGRGPDRLHHRRARHRDAGERPLLGGDRAPGVAQRRSGGEHEDLAVFRAAAQAGEEEVSALPDGLRQLRAAGCPQSVEDDLDQPRPAAGAGTVRLGDPAERAGDHGDVLPREVLAELARALSPLDELVAELVEADCLGRGAHHLRA